MVRVISMHSWNCEPCFAHPTPPPFDFTRRVCPHLPTIIYFKSEQVKKSYFCFSLLVFLATNKM